jgi:hypothetical protein
VDSHTRVVVVSAKIIERLIARLINDTSDNAFPVRFTKNDEEHSEKQLNNYSLEGQEIICVK